MPQATRSTVPNRLTSTGIKPFDVLEQHRGAVLGEQAGLDLRDLEDRRDRGADAHEAAARFEMGDEVP